MTSSDAPAGGTPAAIRAVVRLSIQQLLRSRKTLVFGLLGMFPPAFATLFALAQQIPNLQSRVLGFEVFSHLMYFIYLQVFLIGERFENAQMIVFVMSLLAVAQFAPIYLKRARTAPIPS